MEKNELQLHRLDGMQIFLRQFKNPLLIILFVATTVSFFLGQRNSSLVILGMIGLSVFLGFWNEFRAEKTVSDLLKKVSLLTTVIRNGEKQEIPVRDLRLGDEVFLTRGSVVPADIEILTGSFEVDESVLTGESVPVIKKATQLFMGTVVTSGQGSGKVMAIGKNTKFGKISVDLSKVKPETEFQRGLRDFGTLLVKVIVVMAVAIFVGNFLLGRPLIDSILFSLAVAIGITPELLPMVVTISLSHGARQMAKKDVIVKRLVAIEDLGNMEVLCTDKTGTLTEGKISLESHLSIKGDKSERVLELALKCNSAVVHHRIFGNPIDTAIWEYALKNKISHNHFKKVAEGDFDYDKRAMWTMIDREFIVKGSPEAVIKMSKLAGEQVSKLVKMCDDLEQKGFRVVAVASKKISEKESYGFGDAVGLNLEGFLTFSDEPKKSVVKTLLKLKELNVMVKILTGDNELVTKHVCSEVGIDTDKMLLGADLEKMSDEKLKEKVWETEIFCRVTPEQKEQIIKALQFGGHTVGFMGDGVNDGPALRLADVGISVNTAVDVAKDTAAVVLLHKSLAVICDGVMEGRRIFANTMKYVLMGTSSNFGNMFSAAGASFFLPFLPMTPSQILLANSLYDISQVTIPTDNVDSEELIKPKKMDLSLIKKYMMIFGPLSSIYDFLTFGVMIFILKASGSTFQTGWFIESLCTQILVIFVIRTRRKFFMSYPSWQVLVVCLSVVALGIILPMSPVAAIFGFKILPPIYFAILILMTVTYLALVEFAKGRLLVEQ